jgi:hypothetical protein
MFTLVIAMAGSALGAGAATAAARKNDSMATAARAAAPLNDSMATPAILGVSTLSGGSASNNTDATFVGEPTPSCQHNTGHTVWWRYRPDVAMVVNLNTLGSDFDTVLTVYRSSKSGLVQVACSDDNNGATSKIQFTASGATSYYIQIGGYSANTGSIRFNYSFRVYNDVFARARVIIPGFTSTFINASATVSGEPSGCTSTGKTVWYKYQPTANRRVTFDTFGSSFDSQVAVFRGTSLGALTFLMCADDTDETDGDGSASWTAQAGQTYYIQVGGYQGEFGQVSVNFLQRP